MSSTKKSTSKDKPKQKQSSGEPVPPTNPPKKDVESQAPLQSAIVKFELLSNLQLSDDAQSLQARLQRRKSKPHPLDVISQPQHLTYSQIMHSHLSQVQVFTYMLRCAFEREKKQNNRQLDQIWGRYCKKGECIEQLQFYQMIREVLPNIGAYEKYIDFIYFVCRNVFFKKIGKNRFKNMLKAAGGLNPLSIRIRLTVNPSKRPSLKNALLGQFQRNDLDGQGILQITTTKRILADNGLDLTKQEQDFLASQKLIVSKHSDDYMKYSQMLNIAFGEDKALKQLFFGVFANILINIIKRAKNKIKKKKTGTSSAPQTAKTNKSQKTVVKMDDFIKKSSLLKPKVNPQFVSIAKSILDQLISNVPQYAIEKTDEDLDVIKDILITEKISENQHTDLMSRVFASSVYGRNICLDRELNLIQYDLPSDTQLPRVSLRNSCPVPNSSLLDFLVTSNNYIYLLSDDWHLLIWQLTGSTYQTRLRLSSTSSTDLNRFYRNNRHNNLFPKFLSESENYVIVNHSFCDSCVTLIDKKLLVVAKTVRVGKRQVGLTVQLVQSAIEFEELMEEGKRKGKRVFNTSTLGREGLSKIVGGQLLDYLMPIESPEISTEQLENMMNLLLRKYRTQDIHVQEKNYKVLCALNNYYLANLDKSISNSQKFTQLSLRKFLLSIDRRTTPNQAESFFRFVTQNKLQSFDDLKNYVTKLNFSKLSSHKFIQSIFLIFEKCIEGGINIRQQLSKLGKQSQISKLDLKGLLQRLPVGLTEEQIDYLLEKQIYTNDGMIETDVFLTNSQIKKAEGSSSSRYNSLAIDAPNVSILPDLGLEDVIYLEALDSLVYTVVYPRKCDIYLSTIVQNQAKTRDSVFLVAILKWHKKGGIPPLIYYERNSGFFLSADKSQNHDADVCVWDLRFKQPLVVTSSITITPCKVIKSAHKRGIINIAYLFTSQVMVTSSLDGCVKLWDPVSETRKGKKHRVKIKPGYYSYLSEEMVQTSFIEVKRMLFKQACYSLVGVTLRYILPGETSEKSTELCIMQFGQPISLYGKSVNNLVCVYAVTRLKIQIKESKWQDQLPKKLLGMLEEMAQNRRRKMVNFKVEVIPVVQQGSQLGNLYCQLINMNYIGCSLKKFRQKVTQFSLRHSKNKVMISQIYPRKSAKENEPDTSFVLEHLISQLMNFQQSVKKTLLEKPKQRRIFLTNLLSRRSLRKIRMQDLAESFTLAGAMVKPELLEEVFNCNCIEEKGSKALNLYKFVSRLILEKQLDNWERFMYNLAKAKSVLLYRGQLEQITQTKDFLLAVKQADVIKAQRLQIISDFISGLPFEKVKRLMGRIPVKYEMIVPNYHKEMIYELNKLKESKIKQLSEINPSDYTQHFISLIKICSTQNISKKELISYLSEQLLPKQHFLNLTFPLLSNHLKSLGPQICSKILSLCQNSPVQVELPLFINYIHYNTNINIGSLLPLALQKRDDLDYQQIFGKSANVGRITYSNPNITLRKIITVLTADRRKELDLAKLCEGYREGGRILFQKFEQWLQNIQCTLDVKEVQDFFYQFLQANTLNYAQMSRLQEAVQLALSRVSCFFDQQIWENVMDFYGQYPVTDLKNCLPSLKGSLSKRGIGAGSSQTNLVTVKEFYAVAERLYRARRARSFTSIACYGSMNDIDVVRGVLKDSSVKLEPNWLIHLGYLQNALQLYEPKKSIQFKPNFYLNPQVILPKLPKGSEQVQIGDLVKLLEYSDPQLSMKQLKQTKDYFQRSYGESVPIDQFLPHNKQTDLEVCRLAGLNLINSGQPLGFIFARADSEKQGTINQRQCFKALNSYCSSYQAKVLVRLIDFNREMVTLEVFKQRMEEVVLRPLINQLKKSFAYKLYEQNKLHLLQNLSQQDSQKSGLVSYLSVQRLINPKGKQLHTIIIYNWISKHYLSYKEINIQMLQYKPVIEAIEKDIKKWQEQMEDYQRKLKQFLQRLTDKQLSLYQIYIANTVTSDYILTPSKWRKLLSPQQPSTTSQLPLVSSTHIPWYFPTPTINYLTLTKHMRIVVAELAPQNNAIQIFAELVHKKSSYYEVFHFMDTDNTNSIDLQQFITQCINMKISLSNEVIKNAFLQISQFQRTFDYQQFIKVLAPLASQADKNDWIFQAKRVIMNGAIKLQEELVADQEKFFMILSEAQCQRFMNLTHGMKLKEIEGLLESVDVGEVLLKRLQNQLAAKGKRRDISDKTAFQKLASTYLANLSLTKKEKGLLWDAYVNSKTKATSKAVVPVGSPRRGQDTIRLELNAHRVSKIFQQQNIQQLLEKAGVNKFSKITRQSLKEILNAVDIIIPTKDVDSVIDYLGKGTYRQLLGSSKQTDLSDQSASTLLSSIKQSVRDLCKKLGLDLKEMFATFLKHKDNDAVKEKYWLALLVFTLNLKQEHARSLYYYMDDDRNGEISEEEFISKFRETVEDDSGLSRKQLIKMLDIHGNGYLTLDEFEAISNLDGTGCVGELPPQQYTAATNLINIDEWIRQKSQKQKLASSEQLSIKQIPDPEALQNCLVEYGVKVHPRQPGVISEAICSTIDGITLKKLAKGFLNARIQLTEEDKSYFVNYFTVEFNPMYLNLKKIMEFVRRLGQKIVKVTINEPMTEWINQMQKKNITPEQFFQKFAQSRHGQISRDEIILGLKSLPLKSQTIQCLFPSQPTCRYTSKQSFLQNFLSSFRCVRSLAIQVMTCNILKSHISIKQIIQGVFTKLKQKFGNFSQYWQHIGGLTNNQPTRKIDLERLLIEIGVWNYSKDQINELFDFIDDNRNTTIGSYQWMAFWMACEEAVEVRPEQKQKDRISDVEKEIIDVFGEHIRNRAIRPMKLFEECDNNRKGSLTLQEFRMFVKNAGLKITEQHKIVLLMRVLDPMAGKGMIRHLPLMAKFSPYIDVFGVQQQISKSVALYDRNLMAIFNQLTAYELKLFDQDYDGILEIPELFKFIMAKLKLKRKSLTHSIRTTQFLKDIIGLKVADILTFAEKYNAQLEKIQVPQNIDNKITPQLVVTLKSFFKPFNRIQTFVTKMYNSYKYINVKGVEGIALISKLLQMQRIVELLDGCCLSCEDITNYVINIILSVFTGKTFRIPITDDQTQQPLKSSTIQPVPQLKSPNFVSCCPLNPFFQCLFLKDSSHYLIQPTQHSLGIQCSDVHSLDNHLKLNRMLYSLPISMSSVMRCSQLVVQETRGVGFQETVRGLGGLMFNAGMRARAGSTAKSWAWKILQLVKETHQYGLIGLLRPGNLNFHEGKFGFKHMFLALRVNDSGLAKCGTDPKYTCLTLSPTLTPQLHIQEFCHLPSTAPQLRSNKHISTLTPALDIFSFGVLMFVVLFGQDPQLDTRSLAQQSHWNCRRVFDRPLARLLGEEAVSDVWKRAVGGDLGKVVSEMLCGGEELRDVINVIVMCLGYDWFSRPTVDNLLTTVFNGYTGELPKEITECLDNAGEYYSPELHLQALKDKLNNLVQVVCRSTNSDWPIVSEKINILKAIEMLNKSIDKVSLLETAVKENYFDQLLFVVLNFAASQSIMSGKFPLDIVRSQILEVVESFANLLRSFITKIVECRNDKLIPLMLTVLAKAYLNEPIQLLSSRTEPSQPSPIAWLPPVSLPVTPTFNELTFITLSPVYKDLLTNKTIRDFLDAAREDQHIDEFHLQNKLQTLKRQMSLEVNKSSTYYFDLVSVSECLKILHECAKEQNQSKKSALKIVLNYVKSMILSNDINKTRALLDSRIGVALRSFIIHPSQDIRSLVIGLYSQLSLGLLPPRLRSRSTEQVHKSLGILHHLMSTKDRTDQEKFQNFSNDYYGFRAEIVKIILEQICECFTISVLSAIFRVWNADTLALFENLIHSKTDRLRMMNSPVVEAFHNFYIYFSKTKDDQTVNTCKRIHQTIVALNNPDLFKMLRSNPTITKIAAKLKLIEFTEVYLFDLSNTFVHLLDLYNRNIEYIYNELKNLTYQKYDQNAKSKPIHQLQSLRKDLLDFLDKMIRFVRACPRDKMLQCSQLLQSVSTILQSIIEQFQPFQQLSLNVELLVVRTFLFYQQLLEQGWDFFFNPQLLRYLIQQLFQLYSYHSNIQQSQVALRITDMQQTKQLASSDQIVEYVLKHELLRKFTQNRMSQAANSLMRLFVSAMQADQVLPKLYLVGFVSSFCRIAKWQYSLLIAYMRTKTQNLHVLRSYVEQANFRIRVFDIIVRHAGQRFQKELVKAGFIEYIVHTLLESTQQFDMRFYRSSEEFLPFRYSIPLRNEGLSMVTSIFWSKPPALFKELVNQLLKHDTIRKCSETLDKADGKDMRVLDSLWLFSHVLESQQPNLLLEIHNYSVTEKINRLIELAPEIAQYYPVLAAL